MNEPEGKSPGSITIHLEGARNGDEESTQELFDRFFLRLVEISRTRVRRSERVEDSEDAVVESLYDFFRGLRRNRFPKVNDRNSVWPLLITMVIARSKKQVRKVASLKRGNGKVRGDSVFAVIQSQKLGAWEYEFDEVTTLDSEKLAQCVVCFRNELRTEADKKIFDLMCHQVSNRRIAEQLDRPPSTVDRKVKLIVSALSEFFFNT